MSNRFNKFLDIAGESSWGMVAVSIAGVIIFAVMFILFVEMIIIMPWFFLALLIGCAVACFVKTIKLWRQSHD